MDREPHDETEYQFNDAEDATFEPASEAGASQPTDSGRKKDHQPRKHLLPLLYLW